MLGMGDTQVSFPTTNWTLVLRAGGDQDRARRAKLIETYWPAVYAYLRRSGHAREAAAELTQAFFVDVVLGRDLLERADASMGSLRGWIVAALKNFVRDAARRRKARGGDLLRPLEDAWLDREESLLGQDSPDPEATFDRRWELAQLEEALRRCEQHFVAAGRVGHWRLFEARVLRPALGPVEPVGLDRLAAELGFASPAAAAAAVQVVKQRLAALLGDVAKEGGALAGG
jgi:RNA polymerase sigma factor (sigma-70 family)